MLSSKTELLNKPRATCPSGQVSFSRRCCGWDHPESCCCAGEIMVKQKSVRGRGERSVSLLKDTTEERGKSTSEASLWHCTTARDISESTSLTYTNEEAETSTDWLDTGPQWLALQNEHSQCPEFGFLTKVPRRNSQLQGWAQDKPENQKGSHQRTENRGM